MNDQTKGQHFRKTDTEKAEIAKRAEEIRDISVEVYKLRLDSSWNRGKGAVERMLEKDNDGGVKLRERAGAYDALTRAYLAVLRLDR